MSLTEETWRPPIIETRRLILRPFEISDTENVFSYASDPEVTRFMSFERHTSYVQAEEFLNGWVAANYSRKVRDYAICLKTENKQFIGACGLYPKDHGQDVYELGYVLKKSAWGKSYVPEACGALMEAGFLELKARRIYAPIFEENEKSRRAALKMGMTFEGILRSAFRAQGRRWNVAIYSLLPDEIKKPI